MSTWAHSSLPGDTRVNVGPLFSPRLHCSVNVGPCTGSLPGDASVNIGPLFSPRFYVTFVSTMSHKYKEVHAAAAEVLGMVLAYMEEKQHVSGVCVCVCWEGGGGCKWNVFVSVCEEGTFIVVVLLMTS